MSKNDGGSAMTLDLESLRLVIAVLDYEARTIPADSRDYGPQREQDVEQGEVEEERQGQGPFSSSHTKYRNSSHTKYRNSRHRAGGGSAARPKPQEAGGRWL